MERYEGENMVQRPLQAEKEQTLMAIVRPKKKRSTMKQWLLAMGVIAFGFGLGTGTALAVCSPFSKKQPAYELSAGNKQPENASEASAALKGSDDDRVVEIARKIGPCVVSIYNNRKADGSKTSLFLADQKGEVTYGLGSGVIFKEDSSYYYILTNSHVVEGADSLTIHFLGGMKASGSLVGRDKENDIAVVRVLKNMLTETERETIGIAPLGDSDTLKTGELAVAIGTPSTDALNNTVTRGIISGEQRSILISGYQMTVIQTDAAINPGNSGGALVGPTGEIVGINVAKTVNTEGIGFAIPINKVKTVAEDLMQHGSVVKPLLGIMGVTITSQSSKNLNLPQGVYVTSVVEGGSAAAAGIKPEDVITVFNGEKITAIEQLKALVESHKVGETVSLKLIRSGREKQIRLVLKEMP